MFWFKRNPKKKIKKKKEEGKREKNEVVWIKIKEMKNDEK